ncbi:MAG: DUF4126 family protein [Candidatus Acidiferrales bacterium]
MSTIHVLAYAFAIGVIAGLRAMTAPAVTCWAARLQWLNFAGTRLAFLGSAITAYIFAALAIAEIINDKLPKTPSRLAPPSLLIRMVMGGFCGAAFCVAGGASVVLGVLLGALGGLAGAFAGYHVRKRLVKAFHAPDLIIALLEDLVAVGGGFLLAFRI